MARRRSRESPFFSLLTLAALFLVGKKFMTAQASSASPCLPATRTDSTAADVEAALLAAGCPFAAVKIVAAQSAHETAGWKGGLWNWNVGNLTQPDPHQTCVTQPGNALHFAAYANLTAGARAYVDLLKRIGALPLAVAGDLAGYVAELKQHNYAGNADYLAYEAGIARWLAQLT
jgi:hypothetical protein